MDMDEYFDEALGGSNHQDEQLDAYLMKYSDGSPMKRPYLSDSADKIEIERRESCSRFDCNICLDSVEEPVVTLCGHLYCWPCIYKWMTTTANENLELINQQQCPVCRSDISLDTLIPIYQTTELSDCNSPQPQPQPRPGDAVLPPRPANPSCGVHDCVESNSSILLIDNNGGITTTMTTSGIFGELIYFSCFGNSGTSSYNNPNSYHLAGTGTNNTRLRNYLMKMDESLNRISFFLLCCAIACLMLF